MRFVCAILCFLCNLVWIKGLKGLNFGRVLKKSALLSREGSGEIVYGGLQHCGVLVRNTEESKRFYTEVFGFQDESHLRPTKLPYPGAFLRLGRDQIHLMELPNPDPTEGRPEHGGRDRHVALTINNIDFIARRLEARAHAYTLSPSGRRALFTRDLDGNAFEFVEDVRL